MLGVRLSTNSGKSALFSLLKSSKEMYNLIMIPAQFWDLWAEALQKWQYYQENHFGPTGRQFLQGVGNSVDGV